MSTCRSFIRGEAALESLVIGLATQQEQIAQNTQIGYHHQADHLTREQRIHEISGAFEHLDEAHYPAYRATFSRTVRAIDFPHRLPEIPSNDRVSAAQSLVFASSMSKGTPAERSNIEIWSTPDSSEHLIVGIVDFSERPSAYFLISQWSEGKLSTHQDILRAYKLNSSPVRKHIDGGKLVIRIDLRKTGIIVGAATAALGLTSGLVWGVAAVFSAISDTASPEPGPAEQTVAMVCNVIQTEHTYVMETSAGVFIQPIQQSSHVKTSSYMKAGGIGGKGGPGGSHGGGSSNKQHVQVITNPLPVEGAIYDITWQYVGERSVTGMDKTNKPVKGRCSVR